jgi:hypothetical protein
MLKHTRAIVATVLCLGAMAHAGLMYEAACFACGYKVSDLHVGSGRTPDSEHEIYYAAEWKAIVEVFFDTRGLTNNWTTPAVIDGGQWPAYAKVVSYGFAGQRPARLERLDGYGNATDKYCVIVCPLCGEKALAFQSSGKWD